MAEGFVGARRALDVAMNLGRISFRFHAPVLHGTGHVEPVARDAYERGMITAELRDRFHMESVHGSFLNPAALSFLCSMLAAESKYELADLFRDRPSIEAEKAETV